jgi:hypothetical protein
MINVGQAAVIAIGYTKNLYPQNENIQIEEVEMSADNSYWMITVGMDVIYADVDSSPLKVFDIVNRKERIYKTVKIDAETGNAVALKIRKV